MKNRILVSAMAAAAFLCTSQAVLAAPSASLHLPVRAKFGATKMIKFSVRNDSANPVKFKAGDQEMTIAPGKTASMKLAEGVSLIAEETTPSFAAGAVLAVASSELSGATVVIH